MWLTAYQCWQSFGSYLACPSVCLLPSVDYSMEQSLGYFNYFLTGFVLNCSHPKMFLLVLLSLSISHR